MAFDSTKYKPKRGKFLPVLLLLDKSFSMQGEKIQALNQSTQDMIEAFATASCEDVEILLGMITFSSSAQIHLPFAPAKELLRTPWDPIQAQGNTAMGQALMMAHDLLQDSTQLPKNIYRPAVVLVSDGHPNDSWEAPLDTFLSLGRSAKCQRFAIGIGGDMDLSILERFTGEKQNLFLAEDSQALKQHFSCITQTISQRSSSTSPNNIAPPSLSETSKVEEGISVEHTPVNASEHTPDHTSDVPPEHQQEIPEENLFPDWDDFEDFDPDSL